MPTVYKYDDWLITTD